MKARTEADARLVEAGFSKLFDVRKAFPLHHPGDVRKEIKGGLRFETLDARDLIQPPHQHIAPLLQGGKDLFGAIRARVKPGKSAVLAEMVRAGFVIDIDLRDVFDHSSRSDGRPQAPAGHREPFAERVKNDRALSHPGEAGNAHGLAVIPYVIVCLIGEDQEVVCSEIHAGINGERPTGDESKGAPDAGRQAVSKLFEIKAAAVRDIERRAILYALKSTGWKKRAAARMLKISHKALYYKMEDLGIDKKQEIQIEKGEGHEIAP